jgi:hypothetical protein
LPTFLTPKKEGKNECEVSIWLKNLGFSEYVENFKDNGFTDLRPLIFCGLSFFFNFLNFFQDSEDFEILGVKSLGHRKQISSCLKQLKHRVAPIESESFFPITIDELTQSVTLDDPTTLQSFLIRRFGEQSPSLKILKLFHQAFGKKKKIKQKLFLFSVI